ncbi:helix-turn-helix domain-containing protein [Vibrio parahaemolyticus]|uniref:Helix-turn-helix domain-containing protein n=1 Tax=Vibrio parahaemolyticus TaxID=670 RepID=A0A9Q3UJ14_VIBPH|nr:helix-turn-helix domain-containing protein [Vibrio parahaemolyticus]EGU0149926.1 hypothetical protein [Vibrio parahaemolyticus]MCC3807661.1 helix-turn-helix domain-containing protein [Vibrio parahaemolyticus]MCZ6381973.1 helix-turn-helix domain-containing protein [Vibrio parahaemolyticus]MCZ6404542.1 helix-turn-helix domain-containing protein [Vibrio parahaemolyticus]QQD06611.1 helix-turn-helix domain-containing protein [Vibrio parahaemolyticus]
MGSPKGSPIDKAFIIDYIEHLFINAVDQPDLRWIYPVIQKAIAETALIHTHGNQTQAAQLLGIHRETLRRYYLAL